MAGRPLSPAGGRRPLKNFFERPPRIPKCFRIPKPFRNFGPAPEKLFCRRPLSPAGGCRPLKNFFTGDPRKFLKHLGILGRPLKNFKKVFLPCRRLSDVTPEIGTLSLGLIYKCWTMFILLGGLVVFYSNVPPAHAHILRARADVLCPVFDERPGRRRNASVFRTHRRDFSVRRIRKR